MNDTDSHAVKVAAEKIKHGPASRPLFFGMLCSNARVQFDEKEQKWEAVGNTTERPLVVAARKADFDVADFEKWMPRVKENPFSSARKMMSVLVDCRPANNDVRARVFTKEEMDTPFVSVVKGAPGYVLKKCTTMLNADGVTKRSLDAEGHKAVEKGTLVLPALR